jgi:hypothetical protein
MGVLEDCEGAFSYAGELLRLRDLVARTALRRATVHRLLHTLELSHAAGCVRETPACHARLRGPDLFAGPVGARVVIESCC